MPGQCWALMTLKIALLRNTWSTGKMLSIAVLAVLVAAGSALSLALAVGAYLLGQWVAGQDPLMALLVLDGVTLLFFFLWGWGLLLELQRADVVDFRKMLHFPISLRMVFFLNFIASLFSPALLFFMPSALALAAGMGSRVGPRMLLAVPLAAIFFLMLSAWAFYFRGALAIIMENKRRRRIVLTVIPLIFVFIAQLPNILTYTLRTQGDREHWRALIARADTAQVTEWLNVAVPVAWLPYGVHGILRGEAAPAALGYAGLTGLMTLGLALGYRATLRHYTGAGNRRNGRRAAVRAPGTPLTARRIPFLGEDGSAMTWAAFLTYARHPSIRIMMIMPLCMGLLLIFMVRADFSEVPFTPARSWLPLGVLVWPYLNFSFMMLNIFGIDREGFRGMVLLPAPRHKYILAKNLGLFPFAGGLSLFCVTLGGWWLEIPRNLFVISVIQVFQLYLIYCLAGNYVSLYFPYRIGRDTLRANTARPIMFFVGLCSMAIVAILLLPAMACLMADEFAAARWGANAPPVGVIAAIALLPATAAAYAVSLRHAGDLLLLREQRILALLVADRE